MSELDNYLIEDMKRQTQGRMVEGAFSTLMNERDDGWYVIIYRFIRGKWVHMTTLDGYASLYRCSIAANDYIDGYKE